MEPLVLAPDLTVAVVLTRWPPTIPVFLRHRMACVGCPFARFEGLAAATGVYGVPIDSFLSELRSSISGPMMDHCEGERQ